MKVIITKSYEESCKTVADLIIETVNTKENPKLGLATGSTAEGVYPFLIKAYEEKKVDFSKTSTVNLDEYLGMSVDHEQSYTTYMNKKFFNHINIDKSKTYVANGMNDPAEEIKLFNEKLYGDKMLDLQLLGVGVSGHIGFNEPNSALISGVHIEDLVESTIEANSRFFENKEDVPKKSITMGVGDIMKAERIVLIATGDNKIPAMKSLLMTDKISTDCPVDFLKLHRDLVVVIDENLAKGVGFSN